MKKVKVLLYTIGIGSSYFAMDKLYRRNTYKRRCIFMDDKQWNDLLKWGKCDKQKLHDLYDYNSKAKKRVVIIGGGILGVMQAYYLKQLCKNTVDVILVEQSNDICTYGASFANGGFYHTNVTSWTNTALFKKLLKSLFTKETNVVLSLKGLFYKNQIAWGLNYFCHLPKSQQTKNTAKLCDIMAAQKDLFAKLKEELKGEKGYNYFNSRGGTYLYNDQEELDHEDKVFDLHRARGIQCIRYNSHEELVKLDPLLKYAKKKFAGGLLFPQNTCIDVNDFGKRIMAGSEKMGAKKSLNCEFNTFVFKKDTQQIIGVKTSKGIIPCHNVFVCCGLYSPYILNKLGMRLPIMPLKGYTFTQDREPGHDFKYDHLDHANEIAITVWKDKVRWTSLCTDIMGIDYKIRKQRLQRTLKAHDSLMNGRTKLKLDSAWTGLRPLTPDDVPILSRVPKFPQVIINSGHGSKGGSEFIGSSYFTTQLFMNAKNKILDEKNYDVRRYYFL